MKALGPLIGTANMLSELLVVQLLSIAAKQDHVEDGEETHDDEEEQAVQVVGVDVEVPLLVPVPPLDHCEGAQGHLDVGLSLEDEQGVPCQFVVEVEEDLVTTTTLVS